MLSFFCAPLSFYRMSPKRSLGKLGHTDSLMVGLIAPAEKSSPQASTAGNRPEGYFRYRFTVSTMLVRLLLFTRVCTSHFERCFL